MRSSTALQLATLLAVLCLFSCQQKASTPYVNSVIATAHPLATEAGNTMYLKGGNAFDAAIAAAFTLAVVEPSMSGIGGRLQAIYRTETGIIAGVDASTEVPKHYKPSTTKHQYGYPTIGIPGVVAGLIKLHKDCARLPLNVLMAPAINYAENGFKLLPGEAKRHALAIEKLAEFEGSRSHFLRPDTLAYNAGNHFVQKDLAQVLKSIAIHGKAGFYEGEVAQKIVTDMQTNGGLVSLEDLAQYEAKSAQVLKGTFEGHQVHSLYLPSYGAITIQILQILDHLNFTSEEQWSAQVGKATEIAYAYRKAQANKDTLALLLSYNKAAQWAKEIQMGEQLSSLLINQNKPVAWTTVDGHTTHLTTVDRWGNAVSLTQSIGPNMGSKVATKGLGFLYAVTLGGYLGEYKPGDRANSHITPTLVTKNDSLILALGAAGGSRIVTAVTQVMSRFFSAKKDLETAIQLPRVYPNEDSLWIENHMEVKKLNAAFDSLLPVKYISEKARFGRVHAIAKQPDENKWIGAADPDWEGTTAYDDAIQ